MIKSKIFFKQKTGSSFVFFDKIQEEEDTKVSGYYSLPIENDSLIDEIQGYKLKNLEFLYGCERIVVVGTGGSSLGTKAIHNALKYKKTTKSMSFLESTDPLKISMELDKIDIKKSLFVIVSKSGTTIETMTIFKYILSLFKVSTPNKIKDQLIFITDKYSKLESLGKKNGVKTFTINSNIGGRFSVLSAVGLVPLSLAGYNIKNILSGAKKLHNDFLINRTDKHNLIKKALFFALSIPFLFISKIPGSIICCSINPSRAPIRKEAMAWLSMGRKTPRAIPDSRMLIISVRYSL